MFVSVEGHGVGLDHLRLDEEGVVGSFFEGGGLKVGGALEFGCLAEFGTAAGCTGF